LALPEQPARLLLGLLVALVVVYLAALVFLRPPSPGKEVRLDSLTRFAVCGAPARPDPAVAASCNAADKAVAKAELLDQDARIVGELVPRGQAGPRETFWTSYPSSGAATNDLLRNLNASGAEVTVKSQSFKGLVRFVAQFLLPLLLLADLFALLFLMIQGAGGGASQFLKFGRAGDRRHTGEDESRVTFADVAGADEAVAELAEVRDYLANPGAFATMGALPPKGVLLLGPPGCGKTLLVRAVAGEVKANFFSMAGSEFVEALVGIGAARVRDLFAQAQAQAPAVIFIDELDGVGRQRGAGVGQGHDEREQTLNELLSQIDGFSPSQGIVVMGATNRPDILDPALLRAGRFDRQITVERPDADGRLQILRLHAKGRHLSEPDSLVAVAQSTSGFTGADLANVLNEAALLAVRERASVISSAHLDEAVDRVMAGPKRRGRVISDDEKRTVAYHEAGHALVAAAKGKAPGIRKLSIITRGRGVGHLAMENGDHTVVRRAEMEARIAISMAGFAAEEVVFGEPSSGSEADLERATHTARDMAGRYGMSARLGPVRVLAQEKEVFLGRDYLSTADVSQPTLEHLDAEVRRILDEQKEVAASILGSNRRALDNLARLLFERETVQGPDLQQALSLPARKVAPAKRAAAKRA
jgi:cell division protease FtsH